MKLNGRDQPQLALRGFEPTTQDKCGRYDSDLWDSLEI